MNISDLCITMAQTAEIDQPALFPFPFSLHAIFCVVSLIFFVLRFIKEKSPYQLIMAIAIPASLIIWLSEGKALFYAVGMAEVVLLISAFVTSIIFRKKEPAPDSEPESSDSKEE